MIGLASNKQPCVRFGRRACPTLSHLRDAGGTAKVRADWAFVSGGSVVSLYLELVEDYRKEKQTKPRQGLIGATPPALGQVGHARAPPTFLVRQQGRDTDEPSETTLKPLKRAVKV